jgi:hypothetical protein
MNLEQKYGYKIHFIICSDSEELFDTINEDDNDEIFHTSRTYCNEEKKEINIFISYDTTIDDLFIEAASCAAFITNTDVDSMDQEQMDKFLTKPTIKKIRKQILDSLINCLFKQSNSETDEAEEF